MLVAELRSFAAKFHLTVETTVENSSEAKLDQAQPPLARIKLD